MKIIDKIDELIDRYEKLTAAFCYTNEAKREDLKKLWKEKTGLEIPKELNKKVDTKIDFDKIEVFFGGVETSKKEEDYIIQIQKQKRKFMRKYIAKMPLNTVKKLVTEKENETQKSLDEK